MKKILSFLSIFSLVISGTSNIIACNSSKNNIFSDEEIKNIKKDPLNNPYVDVYKKIKEKYSNLDVNDINILKAKSINFKWSDLSSKNFDNLYDELRFSCVSTWITYSQYTTLSMELKFIKNKVIEISFLNVIYSKH